MRRASVRIAIGLGEAPKPLTRHRYAPGETAHLRYFDVTVHEHRDAPNDVEGGGIHGVRVTVCSTHPHPQAASDGTVRTSRDPWDFGWIHVQEPVFAAFVGVEYRPSGTSEVARWQWMKA